MTVGKHMPAGAGTPLDLAARRPLRQEPAALENETAGLGR